MKKLQNDLTAFAKREQEFTKEVANLKREREALFNDNERRQWLEDEHAKEISILASQEEALQEKIRDMENHAEQVKAEKDDEINKIKSEANMIVKILNEQNVNKDKQIQDLIEDSSKCTKIYLDDFAKEKEQIAKAEAERMAVAKAELEKLRKQTGEHESKLKSVQDQLDNSKIEYTQLEKEKVNADKQLAEARKTEMSLRSENSAAKEDIAAKDAQIDRIKNMLKDKLTEVVSKAKEVDRMTGELGKFFLSFFFFAFNILLLSSKVIKKLEKTT